MIILNQINNKISKRDRGMVFNDFSELLTEFFNGVIIQNNQEYLYES